MAEMTRSKEVPVQLLRWTCNPELLGFDTTKECAKTDNIIGQNRAVKAITLGLEIESPGYNIYVSGMTGTGKTTTIKNLLSQLDLKKPIPDDICYVHNFRTPTCRGPSCSRQAAAESSRRTWTTSSLTCARRSR
jgi:ATP-dependent Lon protease